MTDRDPASLDRIGARPPFTFLEKRAALAVPRSGATSRALGFESSVLTRTFLQRVILIPAQVVLQGRRLIIRLLAWRPDLYLLIRILDAW